MRVVGFRCLVFELYDVFDNGGGRARRIYIPHHISQDGYTALIWAAQCGHTDCVRLLVEAGADKQAMTTVRALSRHMFLCVPYCLAIVRHYWSSLKHRVQ